MVRFKRNLEKLKRHPDELKRHPEEAGDAGRDNDPRPGASRAAPGRYANQETAAGLFSRPAPERPRLEPAPPPALRPALGDEPGRTAPLAVRPLRTPAPAVTTIRVEAVPVDGFEYETAAPWCTTPEPEAPPPPTGPAPPRHAQPRRPLFTPLAPKPEPQIINWLDE